MDEEDEAREGKREGERERERERERWQMGLRPSGRANGKIKMSPNFRAQSSELAVYGDAELAVRREKASQVPRIDL